MNKDGEIVPCKADTASNSDQLDAVKSLIFASFSIFRTNCGTVGHFVAHVGSYTNCHLLPVLTFHLEDKTCLHENGLRNLGSSFCLHHYSLCFVLFCFVSGAMNQTQGLTQALYH